MAIKAETIDILGNLSSSSEELKERGVYYVSGEIEEGSLREIQEDMLLKHLDPEWTDDVTIIVNSVGGSVPETWALIDLMDWVRFDVRTTGLGLCASAGACILAAGTQGKRIAAQNCSIMIHGMSDVLFGNAQQIVAQQKYVKDEHEKDIQFWIKHSKYTNREEIEQYFLQGLDVYLTAKEALEHGVVDYIQISKKESARKKVVKKK